MCLALIITLQSCTSQEKPIGVISYALENDIHHFNNKEILLEIDNKMKIIPSYKSEDKVLSVVVNDLLPNDYLLIEDEIITTVDGSIVNVDINTENDIYLKATPVVR